MNRSWITAAALTLAACNSTGNEFVIEGTLAPTDLMKCSFDSTSMTFQLDTQFDAFGQAGLAMFLKVTNNYTSSMINYGSTLNPNVVVSPHSIVPERMDIAYECDAEAFSEAVGPLYLPAFSTTEPFCINRETKSFVGRSIVFAAGSIIGPGGGHGVVEVVVIPNELGAAFADLFNLARKAKACCDSTNGGCSDADLANAMQGAGSACGDLQDAFNLIAGPNKLSSKSATDIQKFLPYGQFDALAIPPQRGVLPPTFPIKVRGILEGKTSDGSTVSSTEWSDVIHICGHCGENAMPMAGQQGNPNLLGTGNGSSACSEFGP